MAGVRGILQQETRRVGPGLCAILAMCTRRLLGLVEIDHEKDPIHRGMIRYVLVLVLGYHTESLALLVVAARHMAPSGSVPAAAPPHRPYNTHFIAKGVRKEAFSFRNSLRLSGWISCV
jgi:hypothetical protein